MSKGLSPIGKGTSRLATRREFLKGAGLAGCGLGASILSGARLAGATDSVAHLFPGEGAAPADDIQAAVDAGGTVILHGKWDADLLQARRIEVGRYGKNVDLIGIEGAEIIGGSWTLLAVSPVKWSVTNLRITGACGTAIGMRTSSDLTVEGCTISVVPQEDGSDPLWAVPICVAPAIGAPALLPRPFYGVGTNIGLPEEVSGRIEIKNNLIDADVPLPSLCSMGILILRSSASCKVVGNTIQNAWFSSIMVIESPGANEIAGNRLNPAAGFYGFGIWLASWAAYALGNTVVSGNVITCGADAFTGLGYGNFVEWDDPPFVAFVGNVVRTNGCDPAIAILHGLVKNTFWTRNRLSGSASAAFLIMDSAPGLGGTGNLFQANEVSGVDLSPAGAHFVFDSGSVGNTVVGFSGSVIDLGTGNTITGGKEDERPMNRELGVAIALAQARLNELYDF